MEKMLIRIHHSLASRLGLTVNRRERGKILRTGNHPRQKQQIRTSNESSHNWLTFTSMV